MKLKFGRKLIFKLFLLILAGLAVFFFFTKRGAEKQTIPAPTESAIDPLILAKIKAKLPMRTNDFSIIYFEESDQFGVTIFQGPYQEKKKMVLNWFKKQGISNPEKLPILWSATRWVTDFEE